MSEERAKLGAVVEIDRWEVNRILRRVLRDRHDVRRIYVMVEYRSGAGRALSNMTAVDRVFWLEAHKRAIMNGDFAPNDEPQSS